VVPPFKFLDRERRRAGSCDGTFPPRRSIYGSSQTLLDEEFRTFQNCVALPPEGAHPCHLGHQQEEEDQPARVQTKSSISTTSAPSTVTPLLSGTKVIFRSPQTSPTFQQSSPPPYPPAFPPLNLEGDFGFLEAKQATVNLKILGLRDALL